MVDHLSPEKRSWNMSRICSKNTLPEKRVRSILHRRGYRYGLNRKDLPGKPDIVLSKYSAVIFVHGCFWHRHKGCQDSTAPKSNIKFWKDKFDYNISRDKKNRLLLRRKGWKVIVVWECELNNTIRLATRLQKLLKAF